METATTRHRLLQRQVKKFFNEKDLENVKLTEFIEAVNLAYMGYEEDHKQSERTLELSLNELFKVNKKLNEAKEILEQKVVERTFDLEKSIKELTDFKFGLDKAAIVAITDAEGIIHYVNDNFAKISQYDKDELLGQHYSLVSSGYHTYEFFHDMWEALKSGKVWKNEIKNKKKNGEFYWVDTTIIPFLNSEGVPFQYLSISFDITKRVEVEEEILEHASDLAKINKELDQFAYVVSHDLKAPLRAINNLSTWIEEDISEKLEDETKKNFTLLRGRVHRMELLINGILDYSRAGRMKSNISNVNLNEFVKDIVDNISPPEKFRVCIAKDMPEIKTEKVALEQVFSNLISNAIKYNHNSHPIIKIEQEEKNGMMEFSIEDNGEGIEPEFHKKIFIIFQTLNARDKVESTGVGLSIVKKIVEEKGGKIKVESEKGKGSKFIFTWPKNK